jgi:hypothetical protein
MSRPTPTTREHMPIQIGLPAEPAWAVAEPAPISYLAFVTGDELPDPGAAFTAAGESFGLAPQDVEPLPIEDDRVAWAFSFSLPNRGARAMLWCEHAIEGASPDGKASDARWVIFIETLLEQSRAVDDAIALAATVARAGAARTRLVFDPSLGVAWGRAEIDELLLGTGMHASGELIDERHLYRVELVARDRTNGPYWIATVGLARAGLPELELLEVPVAHVRAGLELVDALAARLLARDGASGLELPHAGVPFEAGPGLRVALVPALEAAETLAPGVPGDAGDRRGLPPGPRAAICAAGKRGAFRQVWVSPIEELACLSRNEAGLYLAPRVSLVRERVARRTWSAFRDAFQRHATTTTATATATAAASDAAFLAKISRGDAEGTREHVWITVEHADADGGRGILGRAGAEPERVEFTLDRLGDWRIVGLRAELPEVGPESARLLA